MEHNIKVFKSVREDYENDLKRKKLEKLKEADSLTGILTSGYNYLGGTFDDIVDVHKNDIEVPAEYYMNYIIY